MSILSTYDVWYFLQLQLVAKQNVSFIIQMFLVHKLHDDVPFFRGVFRTEKQRRVGYVIRKEVELQHLGYGKQQVDVDALAFEYIVDGGAGAVYRGGKFGYRKPLFQHPPFYQFTYMYVFLHTGFFVQYPGSPRVIID